MAHFRFQDHQQRKLFLRLSKQHKLRKIHFNKNSKTNGKKFFFDFAAKIKHFINRTKNLFDFFDFERKIENSGEYFARKNFDGKNVCDKIIGGNCWPRFNRFSAEQRFGSVVVDQPNFAQFLHRKRCR